MISPLFVPSSADVKTSVSPLALPSSCPSKVCEECPPTVSPVDNGLTGSEVSSFPGIFHPYLTKSQTFKYWNNKWFRKTNQIQKRSLIFTENTGSFHTNIRMSKHELHLVRRVFGYDIWNLTVLMCLPKKVVWPPHADKVLWYPKKSTSDAWNISKQLLLKFVLKTHNWTMFRFVAVIINVV